MSDPFRIDGLRALVTGANTGIGQAAAVGLAERGAHVLAAGRSSCAETVAMIAAAAAAIRDRVQTTRRLLSPPSRLHDGWMASRSAG